MIAIINYGVGNLFSLSSSLRYLGIESAVTGDPELIKRADGIILPGVGAFANAAKKLEDTGLVPLISDEANSGKPLLGICLGMQLLFDRSFEYGIHKGLGLIHGDVMPLAPDINAGFKVPHMGWNSLKLTKSSPIFKYVDDGEYVYYVHSYYAKNCEDSTIAVSEYGGVSVTGAVCGSGGRIYGTQFHPEKSGETGLSILRAFSEL